MGKLSTSSSNALLGRCIDSKSHRLRINKQLGMLERTVFQLVSVRGVDIHMTKNRDFIKDNLKLIKG